MGTAQSPRISIYVDNTHYRKQDTESKAVAKSIESIYCELTSLAKAEYGYLDNERWETMDNPTLNSPLLFGVTIISLTVVENLPLDPIMEYTHHITHTNDGLVIFFSEFPWEIDIDLMPVINQMWHKIID